MTIPSHLRLRKGDLPFWNGILRARAEWADADLVVAAQLARCQWDIETESEALEGEQTIVTNAHGKRVINPRFEQVQQLVRREMALLRTLRIGGRVAGDAKDEAGRRQAQRQAEKVREELAEDELLAKS